MLYAVPAAEEPISQGDIVDACPIFGLEGAATSADLDAAPARWQERVIVLTQACDLAQHHYGRRDERRRRSQFAVAGGGQG